jgi:hypothetical protein
MAAVQRPKGNVPTRPLRWTTEAVAREFKLGPNTAKKILNQGGMEPDVTGCYSTEQIVACLFGDLRAERLRKERELVRRYRLENEAAEATLLNRVELMKGFSALADAMVCRIRASELSREAQDDLLKALASIPVVINDVAKRQSRLRRNGNGPADEEELPADESACERAPRHARRKARVNVSSP